MGLRNRFLKAALQKTGRTMLNDADDRYRQKFIDLVAETKEKERALVEEGKQTCSLFLDLLQLFENHCPAADSACIEKMKTALADGFDPVELAVSLDALRSSLNCSSSLSPCQVLIDLMRRIPIPSDLEELSSAVIDACESKNNISNSTDKIEKVASFICRIQEVYQEEKSEMKSMLVEMTEKLGNLNSGLSIARKELAAEFKSIRIQDQEVGDQVRSLNLSAQSTNDIKKLRKAVSATLESIKIQIKKRQEDEARREDNINKEMDLLRRNISHLENKVNNYHEKILETREKLLSDPLTGVNNRLAYNERAKAEFARWERYDSALSFLIMDLDYFKRINDAFGHQSGDRVLQTIAGIAAKTFRKSDFFCRFGGEEFVALLPETMMEDALAVAEKIRISVENFNFHFKGERLPITVSFGVTQLRKGDSIETAFERADKALYTAKENGRNRCVVDPDIQSGQAL